MKQVFTTTKQVFICCFLCVFAYAQAEYPKVEANVPYSKVAELSHQAWSSKHQYGEHSDQYVLHWPASTLNDNAQTRSKMAVVFIHGGCWLEQFTIEHSLPLTSAFSQAGFEVFSVEYRRSGNGGEWPTALDDIAKAIGLIQSKLMQPIPKLAFVGHSAGGHLASLAALKHSDGAAGAHFIGLAPIMDIAQYAEGENSCQSATPAFMQGTPTTAADAYQEANPINYDLAQLASATIFVGGQDSIVPIKYARHTTTNLVLAENAGHFDWIHPGSEAFKRVVAHLDAISAKTN